MGVESVSVARALTHAYTFKISCHSPILAYCCQLWNPWKAKDIQTIEAIQRSLHTKSLKYSTSLNYWVRLHELKLYSIQRRRERYIIIYIWKITQHMVPNIDGTIGHPIKTRKHQRHGTQCVIQYPTNTNRAQFHSGKCNNCVWASIVQLVAKISERHRKC